MQSKHISRHSIDKPLPQEPDSVQPAVQATLPRTQHQHRSSNERSIDRPSHRLHASVDQTNTNHKRTSSKMQPREPQSPRSGETSVMATFIKHTGPTNSTHAYGNNTSSSAPTTNNDSAYSSGSDPAGEGRSQKRTNTPARFGLFPDSKPATPESLSRVTSTGATTPVQADKSPSTIPPHLAARPNHFSLKRIFHRKHRSQPVN
jgi:hypothetical protein